MDNQSDITNTINIVLTQYIDKEYYITNTINMIVRATHLYATPEHLYATPVYNTRVKQSEQQTHHLPRPKMCGT